MKLDVIEDEEVGIDMSPMIDMVFLLLIFFIVASAMVDVDKPKVELPSAQSAKVADDIKGRVNVSINAEDVIFIGSEVVTEEKFKTVMSEELELNPDLRVFIRSDANVPYRSNKKLMELCADVGAVNLIYAAFEE